MDKLDLNKGITQSKPKVELIQDWNNSQSAVEMHSSVKSLTMPSEVSLSHWELVHAENYSWTLWLGFLNSSKHLSAVSCCSQRLKSKEVEWGMVTFCKKKI